MTEFWATVRRNVPLYTASFAGLCMPYHAWYLALPLLMLAVWQQGRLYEKERGDGDSNSEN